MKIDIFSHILTKKYLETYTKKNKAILQTIEARTRAVTDLDIRFRLMDRYPDILQVLTIARIPLESYVNPDEAAELAKIANDELAELVDTYPNRFAAGVACLPMNNIDAALEEVDRAITKLGLKGVQIYTRIKWVLSLIPGFYPNIKHPEEHFRKFYNDTAVYGNTPALMCGYAFFGADHLLYGTDSPLGPRFGLTGETAESVERMSIPDEEKEKIFFRNAAELLMIAH
jgi:predicted TIM-barrel fold metal-dependent hydrolase